MKLKLSEAIALGQGTVGKWEAGALSHCALGMARNAVGIKPVNAEPDGLMDDDVRDYDAIRAYWPWITGKIKHNWRRKPDGNPWIADALEIIYDTFDTFVMGGMITFEKFLDWIKSIEPREEEVSNEAEKTAESEVCY